MPHYYCFFFFSVFSPHIVSYCFWSIHNKHITNPYSSGMETISVLVSAYGEHIACTWVVEWSKWSVDINWCVVTPSVVLSLWNCGR